MKLKFEHIVPYLRHGLKVKNTITGKIGQISTIIGLGLGDPDNDVKLAIGHDEAEHVWMFQPVLKSLNKLTKKEREEFYDMTNGHTDIEYIKEYIISGRCDYWMFNALVSKSYDVFDLIKDGLAISEDLE